MAKTHCKGKGRDRAKTSLDGTESSIWPKNRCKILIKMEGLLVDLCIKSKICTFYLPFCKSNTQVFSNSSIKRAKSPTFPKIMSKKWKSRLKISSLSMVFGNLSYYLEMCQRCVENKKESFDRARGNGASPHVRAQYENGPNWEEGLLDGEICLCLPTSGVRQN